MLRERVLERWKDLKENYLKGLDLLSQVGDGLHGMGFGTSGLGIKKTPYQVMAKLKKSLPSITQQCQELRNKSRSGQFCKIPVEVNQIYLGYIELVLVYEKIIEYYDQDDSGPTIEEVD